MNNDDALEVEGRALPPIVTSSIRTITPYLVGYVLAAVLLVPRAAHLHHRATGCR